MIVWRWLRWAPALVVLAAGCDDKGAAQPAASASARPVRLPEDGEADEAVRVLAGLYQPTVSVHSAVDRARECIQKTPGFEPLAACLDKASAHASGIAKQVPSIAPASGACGQAIEKAERELLAAAPAYLTQLVQSVRAKQAELSVSLRTRSLAKLCSDKPAACAWLPKDPAAADSPSRAADLSNVLGVPCTGQLFQCGDAAAPCAVLDVIERLGLSVDASKNKVDGSPPSLLKVRASQRPIPPLRH